MKLIKCLFAVAALNEGYGDRFDRLYSEKKIPVDGLENFLLSEIA